jgi:hypothetical protein
MRKALLIAILTVLLTVPAQAPAKIQVVGNEGGVLDTFDTIRCRASGSGNNQDFFASGKSENRRFRLSIFIDAPVFKGFGRDYEIFYGAEDPQVFLTRLADDEKFSNFTVPGTPPGLLQAGEIKFNGRGTRMGAGMYSANNKEATEGLAFAGGVRCKYRRR